MNTESWKKPHGWYQIEAYFLPLQMVDLRQPEYSLNEAHIEQNTFLPHNQTNGKWTCHINKK